MNDKTRAVEGAVAFIPRGVNTAAAGVTSAGVGRDRNDGSTSFGAAARAGGFVRRGDAITVSSNEAAYHVLRARGDAFFSLPCPSRIIRSIASHEFGLRGATSGGCTGRMRTSFVAGPSGI